MSELSSSRRKELRGLAHGLKPVVHVGRHGVTESVISEIDRALDDHELIKVRLTGSRDDRARDAASIAEQTGAAVAGVVGSVAILYREAPPES